MAAASYTTDLVDIITDPAATTGWTLISSGGGGASSFSVPETDDYIQGNQSISRNPWTAISIRGMVYNSAQTIPAGSAVFIWAKSDVAQALDTRPNGGIQALVGNATTALKCYYVDGSDTYALGGWKCYPIDPTITQSASIGSPTTATDYFGMRWSVPVSGPSKGFPYKIDALRVGSTLTLTAGDLGNGYATFTGVATFQGALTRQWGLFQFQNGTYLMQGKFQMGTSGTAVDFRDSNRAIFIADTIFVPSGFNSFEINNAASRVDWSNISISSLGTVSRGNFVMNANATVNFTSNTFTDMGTFAFLSNATDLGGTYRRCQTVTPAGATFTDSLFTNTSSTTGAITIASPSDIANMTFCSFTNNTTGPGIRITTAGTYSFIGHQFSGNTVQVEFTGTGTCSIIPSSGSNVNQANVSATGGGTITVETPQVNVILTGLKADSEVRAYLGTNPLTATVVGGIESSGTSFTFSQAAGGQDGYIQIFHVLYQPVFITLTYSALEQSIPIQQIVDRQYDRGTTFTPG